MSLGFNAFTWLIFGGILLFLETLAAGFYLLFLGVAAFFVGLLLLFMKFPPDIQLYLFAVFSLLSVFLAYKFKFYDAKNTSHPSLNAPHLALIGQSFTLESPIENGRGVLKIGDSLWQISGENSEKGTRIKIASFENGVLKVSQG